MTADLTTVPVKRELGRPTILDRDDVAVVPVEPTEEMIFFGFDGWNGFAKPSNKMCNAFRRMLSASPHSSAWQEVREYVAGLEAAALRVSAELQAAEARVKRLVEAAISLANVADAAGDAANIGMMDEAIENVRAILKEIET